MVYLLCGLASTDPSLLNLGVFVKSLSREVPPRARNLPSWVENTVIDLSENFHTYLRGMIDGKCGLQYLTPLQCSQDSHCRRSLE